jgi:hypothetical protein
MIKTYLNSEIGIKIHVVIFVEVEIYTIRKSSDLFCENYRGFSPTGCYENDATWLQN